MIWVEFQCKDTKNNYVFSFRDRSIIILNSKKSKNSWKKLAKEHALTYGFQAYQIKQGKSFKKFIPVTDIILV